jgi:hypothetical protein
MSQPKLSDSDRNANIRMEKRDGETYIALGIFIVALGLPVLAGTYWAAQTSVRGAVVNAVCGVVLILIGAASMGYGWLLLNRNLGRA